MRPVWRNLASIPSPRFNALSLVIRQLATEGLCGDFDSLMSPLTALRVHLQSHRISCDTTALIGHTEGGALVLGETTLNEQTVRLHSAELTAFGRLLRKLKCYRLYLLGCESATGSSALIAAQCIEQTLNEGGRKDEWLSVFGATTLLGWDMFDGLGLEEEYRNDYTARITLGHSIYATRDVQAMKWLSRHPSLPKQEFASIAKTMFTWREGRDDSMTMLIAPALSFDSIPSVFEFFADFTSGQVRTCAALLAKPEQTFFLRGPGGELARAELHSDSSVVEVDIGNGRSLVGWVSSDLRSQLPSYIRSKRQLTCFRVTP